MYRYGILADTRILDNKYLSIPITNPIFNFSTFQFIIVKFMANFLTIIIIAEHISARL